MEEETGVRCQVSGKKDGMQRAWSMEHREDTGKKGDPLFALECGIKNK
jgi:hypothetical protein